MINTQTDLTHWLTLRARVEPPRLRPGDRGRLVVEVETPSGSHIEAHQPPEPFLIPTVLTLEPADSLIAGDVTYPTPVRKTFDWSPVELQVYSGMVRLEAPIEVTPGAEAGMRTLRGALRYQGCTPNACLPPNTQSLEAKLEIGGVGPGDEALPAADAVLDAPGMACATLTPRIKASIRELTGGQVLEVRSDDSASRQGVPAWCRLTGNALLATIEEDAEHTRFYIRRA